LSGFLSIPAEVDIHSNHELNDSSNEAEKKADSDCYFHWDIFFPGVRSNIAFIAY
jgi:hypothetical protein